VADRIDGAPVGGAGVADRAVGRVPEEVAVERAQRSRGRTRQPGAKTMRVPNLRGRGAGGRTGRVRRSQRREGARGGDTEERDHDQHGGQEGHVAPQRGSGELHATHRPARIGPRIWWRRVVILGGRTGVNSPPAASPPGGALARRSEAGGPRRG
jgi:hypothetical protein